MDIQLHFINEANTFNNPQVVVFQKNVAAGFQGMPVAWKVIENCGLGDVHDFAFPGEMYVGASDSYGNASPQLLARNGSLFSMRQTPSGNSLSRAGTATNANQVQVLNALPAGAMNAACYRASHLLALQTCIASRGRVAFQFEPTIWIGCAFGVVQGTVMSPATVFAMDTELSLRGVTHANIVMTGGGPGAKPAPYRFHLDAIAGA